MEMLRAYMSALTSYRKHHVEHKKEARRSCFRIDPVAAGMVICASLLCLLAAYQNTVGLGCKLQSLKVVSTGRFLRRIRKQLLLKLLVMCSKWKF